MSDEPLQGQDGSAQTGVEPPDQTSSSPSSDDYGSAFSRFQEAGIDLRKTDPVTVARGIAVAEKIGNKRYFTEDDVSRVVENALGEIARTPQGIEYLRKFIGDVGPQPSAGDDDDLDPGVRSLQQKVSQLERLAQTFEQQQQTTVAEREAQKVVEKLTGMFDRAVEDVPRASSVKSLLDRIFTSEMTAGMIPQELWTQAGIRAWVKQQMDDLAGMVQSAARAPGLGSARAGAVVSKPFNEWTGDDVLKSYMARLPD